VNFLPKLCLEIAIASEQLSRVMEALATSARTGQIGDGKIFVAG
jgi:nitrogen regulatory protein PII